MSPQHSDHQDNSFRNPALLELAGALGIHTQYHDIWGNLHTVPEATLRAVVSSMGHEDIDVSLQKLKNLPWTRLIEPVSVVLAHEQPSTFAIHFPLKIGMEPEVVLETEFTGEDGSHEKHTLHGITPAKEAIIHGKRHVRVDIPNKTNRPLGYHCLKVRVNLPALSAYSNNVLEGRMRLIVAPERCHYPEGKCWGITMSLYGLRSQQNAGVGDLGDLREFLNWAGSALGAGFVGINPLHSIPNSEKEGISPYSPVSRIFRSLLYIDLGDLPFVSRKDLLEAAPAIQKLREAEFVDYDEVRELKTAFLEKSFQRFTEAREAGSLPPEEHRSYNSYLEEEGEALELHATFMAMANCEALTTGMAMAAGAGKTLPMGYDWRAWPRKYHDPKGQAVQEFREKHSRVVEFHRFIQWVLENQLARAASEGGQMPLGLYLDLAVGSSASGSDTWVFQEVFALGMNAGAPPDDFNPQGQNWIFPPLLPEDLRESGYQLFIDTLRANLRHAGALRIDHALGLFRVFFIPEGRPASEGTYVNYPAEDLLRIISLESIRAKTAIIAEDLGSVTEEARTGLARRGMLSYRILYFERDWQHGSFLPPESYPAQALAAVNTHDLPTLRGFWEARDLWHRKRLGIIDTDGYKSSLAHREREKASLINALQPFIKTPKTPDNSPPDISDITLAAHAYLASTPTLLTSTSLDDITNSLEQQNMPGTTSGHPNWKRKSALTLEQLKDRFPSGGHGLALSQESLRRTS